MSDEDAAFTIDHTRYGRRQNGWVRLALMPNGQEQFCGAADDDLCEAHFARLQSAPTLAEVLSPYLADMRIKAANLRQGAPRIAEFADVADWIEGWELAIATALQNAGTSTPETATPEPTGPERVNTLLLPPEPSEPTPPSPTTALAELCYHQAAEIDRLTAALREREAEQRRDALDGQATLDEANNEIIRLQQRVRELEVIRSTVRPRIERLLAQCGFATPMILRILDPVFGDGPADHGADFAARKHPDCVAVMCGKVDCRSSGPCYTLVHPRAEEKGTDV